MLLHNLMILSELEYNLALAPLGTNVLKETLMGAECVWGGQLCPLLFHPKAGSGVCLTCPPEVVA